MRINRTNLIILSLLLIQLTTAFYRLEEKLSFGWDQERDAQIEWQMIRERKLTLIGPRVVGPDSFFLGPLWFYILLPFYLIFNMDPLAIGVLGIIINATTLAGFYFIGRDLFGVRVGFLAALLYLPTGAIVVWNPVLIPLFTLILVYFFAKVVKGCRKVIPLAFLFWGLSLQLHFQAIFFSISLFLSLWFYRKIVSKLPTKNILAGLVLFILTFLPLIIFDIRHNFINSQGFLKLFFGSQSGQVNILKHFFDGILKYISSIGSPYHHFNLPTFVNGLIILTLASWGFLRSNVTKPIKYILFSLLVLAPILLSLYGGTLSEYYFTLTLVPIIFGFSLFLEKLLNLKFGKVVFLIFLFLVVVKKFIIFNSAILYTNLYFQKQAVSYIISQNQNSLFNVSYSVPANADAGFRYLFKYEGRGPQDIPQAHLWTIVIPPDKEGVNPLAVFGNIGVIKR